MTTDRHVFGSEIHKHFVLHQRVIVSMSLEAPNDDISPRMHALFVRVFI